MVTSPAATPPTEPLSPLTADLPPVEQRARIPAGFLAGGRAAGIKASGRPDLAVVAATSGPASVAAVFTTNQFAAAPVRLSRTHLAATAPEGWGGWGWAQAVVSTSGCANAATGAAGDADQAAVAARVATGLGIPTNHVLTLSTGLIGTRLPMAKVFAGVDGLVPAELSGDEDGLVAAARALMTTDSRMKVATSTVDLPAADPSRPPVTVRVTGIAKGVGMIHPRMATMLSVVLTDATVEPAVLHGILRGATVRTWNQLSVDGDTSTNDTVFLFASGSAGSAPIAGPGPAAATLERAVRAVARDLARQQAADGEGAGTLITCQVSGARDDLDARAVARSVVGSSLLKAAVHGHDPNWGRIASAAGNARLGESTLLEAAGLTAVDARARSGELARVDPDLLRITVAGTAVYAGRPLDFDAAATSAAMRADEVIIRLDLGLGEGFGEAFGCDLTEEYVVENSAYST